MVAESHFLKSLVNSISSGLSNSDDVPLSSNLRPEKKYEGMSNFDSSICENAGMIIESDAAGGKTFLLELLHQLHGVNRSCLLRSKELISKNR